MCIYINFSTWIYIASITFQIAGALQLMIYAISASRKRVLQRFADKGLLIKDGNTGIISYNKDAFRSFFRTAYLSKCSLFYIAFGYFLSVFGVNDSNCHIIIIALIAVCTIILVVITSIIVTQIATRSKNANREITNDELTEIGIKPDIASISNAEIEEIFQEVFDNNDIIN